MHFKIVDNIDLLTTKEFAKDIFSQDANLYNNLKPSFLLKISTSVVEEDKPRKKSNFMLLPIDGTVGYTLKKALRKYKAESLLILGTSDAMVDKIAQNLDLPEIEERVYITDVATEAEMKEAKRIRQTEGKHVIPVPTFEIKKDFSGYLLDPLQIFKSKGKGQKPYISEKSIIRPTFSYLGNFTISDNVFRQITECVANRMPEIYKVVRVRVETVQCNTNIYIEVIIEYGTNIFDVLKEFKAKCKKEIENLTSMNVGTIDIVAKGIHMPE